MEERHEGRERVPSGFEILFEQAGDGLVVHDLDGRIVDVSRRLCELLGRPKEELCGHSVDELGAAHPGGDAGMQRLRRQLLRDGRVRFEAVYERSSGERIDVEVTSTVVDTGEEQLVFAVLRDVTDRKRAEEESRRFRTITDRAAHGSAIVDLDGRLTYVNEYFARVHGYSPEELIGRDLSVFHTPEQLEEVQQINDSLQRDGGYGPLEVWHVHRDGTEFPMLMSGVLLRDREGEPEYLAASAIDITDRKRAAEEKARLEEQHQQARRVESLGRLAGGVAHDLNNLLTPILGYGGMLLDDLAAEDSRHRHVEEIVHAGTRARDLVRQLLAFGRKQTLEHRPVDLNRAINGFQELLRHTIRENVEIEVETSPGVGLVIADVGQIEQVIVNLAVNAADAMPDGGRLTIRTSRASRPGRDVEEPELGEDVLLSIRDTGRGIDEETRRHLFEPFFTTKGDRGTGLGLSTVYGIVKQHGGEIAVDSEPGRGTTFRVYLPSAPEAVAEAGTRPHAGGRPKRGSETVLLVEDDDSVRRLVQAMLSRQGYRVVSARDGAEALAILDSDGVSVDLLVTDMVMPRVSGPHLFGRACERAPGLKVLYMSGYRPEALAPGHRTDEPETGFIGKPFSYSALAAKVREVLDS